MNNYVHVDFGGAIDPYYQPKVRAEYIPKHESAVPEPRPVKGVHTVVQSD